MKLKALIISLLFVTFFSCSEDQNITSPLVDSKFEKVNGPRDPNYLNAEEATILLDIMYPEWINLPERNNSKNINRSNFGGEVLKGDQYSITKLVKVDEDTELIIDENYYGGIHGEVKIIAKLKFYKNTVYNDTYVTMNVDEQNGSISFEPAMTFKQDAELYVKLEGLDLNDLSRNNIDFVYLANDGSIIPVQYKEIIFDKSSGTLELKENEIPHFSRYGFVRRGPNF